MSASAVKIDGWHRVLRALMDGQTTIKVVRFEKTPPHDYEREV